MQLTLLQVRNYKGIRSANVSFQDTTALIGENETGKATLFEVLREILDPLNDFRQFTYTLEDVHMVDQKPAGDISIRLTFQEQDVGEWDDIGNKAFQKIIAASDKRKRQLDLKVSAQAGEGNVFSTQWQLFDPDGKAVKKKANAKLVKWIRSYKRVIHIPAGHLAGRMSPREKDFLSLSKPSREEAEDPLVKDILHYSERILTRASKDYVSDIWKGFRAAVAYIERYEEKGAASRKLFGLKVSEILGSKEGIIPGGDQRMNLGRRRDISQQLGVLLLTSAWIKAKPGDQDEDVDPIVILADLEAHLHPITLAATAELLVQIKWQKLITSYSGSLISEMGVTRIRRLVRKKGRITEYKVKKKGMTLEDLRKVSYHLGAKNSSAWYNRVWLLFEGESEYWIIPNVARKLGYNFQIEGIGCIEIAQTGLSSIIKLADQLGIRWHLLVDGDEAGMQYLSTARPFLKERPESDHITIIPDLDIEHHFWKNGYDKVYIEAANISPKITRPEARNVIRKASKMHSKPYLSLRIVDAVLDEASSGVPDLIENMLHTVVKLARDQ
jgi:putative ATP-dependent endonuclease of OLD family